MITRTETIYSDISSYERGNNVFNDLFSQKHSMDYIIKNIISRDKRSVDMSLRANLSSFKQLVRNIHLHSIVGDVVKLKQIMGSKIGLSIVDDLLETSASKLKKINGIIHVDDVPLNEFESLLKSSDLRKLVKKMNTNVVVDGSSASSFRKMSNDFPHKKINDIETLTDTVKPTRVEIDFKLSNLDKMSKNGARAIDTIGKRIKNILGSVLKVGLIIGALVLGANWLEEALKRRKGCWLLTTINNKTSSCRLSRNTCRPSFGNENNCSVKKLPVYNTV